MIISLTQIQKNFLNTNHLYFEYIKDTKSKVLFSFVRQIKRVIADIISLNKAIYSFIKRLEKFQIDFLLSIYIGEFEDNIRAIKEKEGFSFFKHINKIIDALPSSNN